MLLPVKVRTNYDALEHTFIMQNKGLATDYNDASTSINSLLIS